MVYKLFLSYFFVDSMKGQAAMEYLMNYSWVIVSITIALGILLASGAFNPAGYNKDYCVGPSVIQCYNIYSEFNGNTGNGILILKLRNDFGFPVRLNNLYLYDANKNAVAINSITISMGQIWGSSEVIEVEFNTNSNNMNLGSLNKFGLVVEYSPCDSSAGSCSGNPYTIKKTVYVSPKKA